MSGLIRTGSIPQTQAGHQDEPANLVLRIGRSQQTGNLPPGFRNVAAEGLDSIHQGGNPVFILIQRFPG